MKKVVKVSKIDVPVGSYLKIGNMKTYRSENTNFNFNMDTGHMVTWGKTVDDDPIYGSFPFILDVEVTTICNGPDNKLCGFCYKNNNPNGYNMPLEHFKTIIDKMPWLTQCALGADAQGVTNPDLFGMMQYARSKGIIPNLTLADRSSSIFLDSVYDRINEDEYYVDIEI